MKQLSEYLGDKKFFMGDEITIADFLFIDVICWNLKLDSKIVTKYVNLVAFKDRFNALPRIKSFLSGDKAFPPIFAPIAFWANK
jgi:glutathione S-transferase